MDQELIIALGGLGAYLSTLIVKKVFPNLPSVLVPWLIVPLLGILGGLVANWATGTNMWLIAVSALLAPFINGIVSQTAKAAKGDGTTVGEAAKSAPFWLLICLGGSLFSPMVAQSQTWETKTLWEPDYTVGLITVKSNPVGDGIITKVTPGIGLGLAYSSVSSSNGEDWDLTNWSVAMDPLYIERDESGALFWVPGLKGSVFNEFLQLYVGYKIGSLAGATFGDRVEIKFGTSLTGVWDGLTGAVGI